ncbi:MAG: hypothetical protein N2F24_18280, partial [Deltaproteobacteria bacterium]
EQNTGEGSNESCGSRAENPCGENPRKGGKGHEGSALRFIGDARIRQGISGGQADAEKECYNGDQQDKNDKNDSLTAFPFGVEFAPMPNQK